MSAPQHRRSRLPRRLVLGSATAVLTAAASFVAMTAFAADGPPGGWNPPDPNNPPAADLVSHCQDASGSGACSFQFNATNYWTSVGAQVQVGRTALNCGTANASTAVSWTHTEGQSNSLGVSVAQELQLFATVKTTVTVSYNHTWDFSDATSETDTLTVPPNSIGWITLAPSLQNVQGDLVMHFNPNYSGHGWWKVSNYVQTGPDPSSSGNVYFTTRTMTDAERATCPNRTAGLPAEGTSLVLVDGPAAQGPGATSTPIKTKQTQGTPGQGTASVSNQS